MFSCKYYILKEYNRKINLPNFKKYRTHLIFYINIEMLFS